jgi:hypothetical protein
MLFILGYCNLIDDSPVIYELSSHMDATDALIAAYQCLLSQPYKYTTIKSTKEDIEKIFSQGATAIRLCVEENKLGEFWIMKK